MISVTLPWPKSNGNHMYTCVRNRKILSTDARHYKQTTAGLLVPDYMIPDGPMAMVIDEYRPRKIGDIDGPIKQIMDAVQGFLYSNDKFVEELHVYRRDDKSNPRIEVTVTSMVE